MSKVGFGVVGCGNIGVRHLAVVHAESKASLAAFCDIDEQKVKKFTAQYPDIPSTTDFDALLRMPQVEVVDICTPHGLHAPMAIAAANAKKHVLVEKPMALSTRDAQAMIDAAQRNNVRLMVVKQNRYNVPIALVKRALDDGRLGRVYLVQCNVLWNRHAGYYAQSNWRGRMDLEGGALYTQVSHFIDLLIWWFGDVTGAQSTLATQKQKIEIEDVGQSNIVFSSGVLGTLTWTTNVYSKNFEGSITIVGERGTIKIGGQYLNKIEYWDVEAYPLPEDVQFVDRPNSYGQYQGTSSNHDRVIHDVAARLLHERTNVVEGEEGMRTIAAIERIYTSARRLGGAQP